MRGAGEIAADQTIHTPEQRLATHCIHGKPVEKDCKKCVSDIIKITDKKQKGKG